MENGGQMKKKFMHDLLLKVDKKIVKISSLNTTSTNICKNVYTWSNNYFTAQPYKKKWKKTTFFSIYENFAQLSSFENYTQLFFPLLKTVFLLYPLLHLLLS